MSRLYLVASITLLCASTLTAQDWTQWRGPNRDNKVVGFNEPKAWPKDLAKKWQVKVGVGEASPVLAGDKIYTHGRLGGDEVTLCLDAATGKEIWRDKIAAATIMGAASGYPGPRSTLALGEGNVVTLGVHGVVTCFDAANGKILWRKETKEKPQFATSTSPIIVDGLCVVFLKALTAYDLKTGDVKWKWTGAETPYGSPVLMTVDGVKSIVTPAMGTLAGVNLADGKTMWTHKLGGGGFGGYQSNYSTPLIADSVVYYSVAGGGKKGGSGGMFALKIEKSGAEFKATELWKQTYSADKYHSPVLADGLIFGVASSSRGIFCADAKTGEQLWTDKTARGQCGCILNAGSVMIESSDKDLVAFRNDRKAYTELAKYRVSNSDTWCVPIVAGNRVYVKDKAGSLTLWTLE